MDGENGVVVDYTYDDSGNIIAKTTSSWNSNFSSPVIGSVVSDITYSYTDSEWKDLLTSYNGQALTYDNIGNPLNYRDGITLTWQNGRELASYADATQNITYTYDAGGLRTGKSITTSSGATTNYSYVYENGLLLKMTRGNRSLEFIYDALGTPVSIKYKSSASATPVYYYYGLNSRGDVVSLYNSDGSVAAIYTYDAYGKLLSVKNPAGIEITSATSIANLNPLRYRGYVYDNETGLYYLQSRYYDPVTCRFVNADGYVSTGQGITGNNMYAYCGNNPVCRGDYFGTAWVDTAKEKIEKIAQTNSLSRKILRSFEKIELKINPTELTYYDNNEITYYNETDESVIARMLYGEDYMSGEAHLWMLQNRLDSGDSYGGSNFRELILNPNQFYAMSGDRALNPKSKFDEFGEKEAWAHCVDLAYAYTDGGIFAIPKPFSGFDYTYSFSYCDYICAEYPNGYKIGGTWFYSP